MPIFRVKMERRLLEEVVVYVEADTVGDIFLLDDETREKLVTHANNYEWWDGDTIGREEVIEALPQHKPVGNCIFKMDKGDK